MGILCKKIDGVLYFLMQAKIEPGNINKQQLYRLAEPLRKTEYGQYLLRVPEEK